MGLQVVVPAGKINWCTKEGIRNRFELAGYLNVTEQFLEDALKDIRRNMAYINK